MFRSNKTEQMGKARGVTLLVLAFSGTALAQTGAYRHNAQGILLPDPALTPGVVLTTDAKTFCAPGYSKRIRRTSRKIKRKVYAAYGVRPHQGVCSPKCEVDHLLPIEDGGADVLANLWPQPVRPTPGFHEKDLVEQWTHAGMCAGRLDVRATQQQLIRDWTVFYRHLRKQ